MSTKRVLKKGVRETFIIIILSIIAILVGIKLYKVYTSDVHKLTKVGYNIEEINKIIELNKQDFFLEHAYHSKLLDFMTAKYYLEKNLDKYLAYYDTHTDKGIDEIITIINVGIDKDFYTDIKDVDLSMGNAILVNKFYKLDDNYQPDDLVNVSNWYSYGTQRLSKEVYEKFLEMYADAKKKNLELIINDSYRTLEDQQDSWDAYGDKIAARAGHSEHNTGLAIDVISPTSNSENFDKTEEFKWLSIHAHEYGFILRYPKDKEYITGYDYESWHYRYLGKELATKVYESGLTYEEYYAYYLEK